MTVISFKTQATAVRLDVALYRCASLSGHSDNVEQKSGIVSETFGASFFRILIVRSTQNASYPYSTWNVIARSEFIRKVRITCYNMI